MKRLILIRHAQADDPLPDQPDWDRPLTRRGIGDAAEMARRLKSPKYKPDLIIASPALRTRQTSDIFAERFNLEAPHVKFVEESYLADARRLLGILQAHGGTAKTLLLVAHNPGITELADQLSQERGIDAMPTCAVFCAEFALTQWCDLLPASGVNVEFDYPHRG